MKHALLCALAPLLLAAPAHLLAQSPPGAGDLDPSIGNGALSTPGGTPQPSMKTIDTVDPGTPLVPANAPFTITDSGYYYFTGNIDSLPSTANIIEVTADDVTIDLRGFAILESASGVSIEPAIKISAGRDRLTVRNGSISGAWESGVAAGDFTNDQCVAEDLRIVGVQNRAIDLGPGGRVSRCQVDGTNALASGLIAGIEVGAKSRVDRCLVHRCDGAGYIAGDNSALTHCIAFDNGGDGFETGDRAVLSYCVAAQNSAEGYDLADRSRISYSSSRESGQAGISADVSSLLTHCTASLSGAEGFFCNGAGPALVNCSSTNNTGDGYFTADGASISGCLATSNGAEGFDGTGRSLFEGCQASLNDDNGFSGQFGSLFNQCYSSNNGTGASGVLDADGFEVQLQVRVHDCYASGNRADGIGATSDPNDLRGNFLYSNQVGGIHSIGTSNLTIGNYAPSNATFNYDPAPGAGRIGPLEDASTGTSPNANFD